jgi:hypothetical protein
MSATLERSFGADAINALANDPAIRPFVGGNPETSLDLTALVDDERNICLMGEHGCFVLNWTSPGCYEVHTMVRPEGRGAWALSAAKLVLDIMGDAYAARQVWTRIRPDYHNVRTFALSAGMKPCGSAVFDIGAGPEAFNLYEKIY